METIPAVSYSVAKINTIKSKKGFLNFLDLEDLNVEWNAKVNKLYKTESRETDPLFSVYTWLDCWAKHGKLQISVKALPYSISVIY